MPEYIREIITRLMSAGFEAYAVGGCVRDTLLSRTPHDWDVATSASDSEIAAIFERTVPTGIKYGTVTVILPGGRAEVTTFRVDGRYLDGRKPESVEFVSDLREDLARRDFTVNAMAMRPDGEVIDLYGGRRDLERGVIRCVGDPEQRFSEDALRMLRAVRFSAQLGFTIEPETLKAIKLLSPLAGRLSAERIQAELERTLLSPRPETAGLLIEYGLLGRFMTGTGKNFPSERLSDTPEDLRTAVFALLARLSGLAGDAGELLRALRCPARESRLASEAEAVISELRGGGAGEDFETRLLTAFVDHDTKPVLAACAAVGEYARAREVCGERRFVRPTELNVKGSDIAALGFEGERISAVLRSLALSATFGTIRNSRAELIAAAEAMARWDRG